jgi:hypothetical protein
VDFWGNSWLIGWVIDSQSIFGGDFLYGGLVCAEIFWTSFFLKFFIASISFQQFEKGLFVGFHKEVGG